MKKVISIFFLLTICIFSNSVDTLQNKVKKIEAEIKQKNTRIKNIDSEKKSVADQISDIEAEISTIEKESSSIQSEIDVINKNIGYGVLNLRVINETLNKKKNSFNEKIRIIGKRADLNKISKNRSIAKRNFSNLLYDDLKKIEDVNNVQTYSEEVKYKTEDSRKKLNELNNKLNLNKQSVIRKKSEKNNLIARLNKEKTSHVKTISKLSTEKKKIEKEIERIIKSRSKKDKTVDYKTAISKIGKLLKPMAGKIVVKFKENKNGEASSNGIEIAGKLGNVVKSSTAGKVIYADKFQGLNNVVMIDYGKNIIGVYGNLISYNVKLNDAIAKGQDIGVLGLNTNKEANLYYEVRFNLKPINPESLF